MARSADGGVPRSGGDGTEEHPREDWLTTDRSGDTARRVERQAAAGFRT